MDGERKQTVDFVLHMIKTLLKDSDILIGIAVDKKDPNESKIILIDKNEYRRSGKIDGVSVSLDELNKED